MSSTFSTQDGRRSNDLTLEPRLWAPYCLTPGRPRGDGRTRQRLELYRWTRAAAWEGRMDLREGKEGGRMPHDALRDPYALLTQASDTNDCDWSRKKAELGQFAVLNAARTLQGPMSFVITESRTESRFWPMKTESIVKHGTSQNWP